MALSLLSSKINHSDDWIGSRTATAVVSAESIVDLFQLDDICIDHLGIIVILIMRVCAFPVNMISASIFFLCQIHAVYDCNRSLLFLMIALLVADTVGSVAISVLKVHASETCVHVRLLRYHSQ
jgi:hypothetical protein